MIIYKILYSLVISIGITESIHGSCTSHTALSVGTSIWKQADDLLSAHGANRVIFSSNIPYTISGPGAYAVGETLTATSSSPVIINNFPDVTIDLKGHSIIGGAGSTAGISVGPSGSTHICNGIISGFSAPSSAIYLNASQATIIEDITFINDAMAITATTISRGLTIRNCSFVGTLTAISLNTVSNVSIHDCQDTGSLFTFASSSSAIAIENIDKSLGSSLISFNNVSRSTIIDCNHIGATTSLSFVNSRNNIISYCSWMNATANVISLTGTSTGNVFENIKIHGSTGNAISLGVGVSKTQFISSSILAASAAALISNSGTNTELYNCFLRNSAGAALTGNAITTGFVGKLSVVLNTCNYWQNLSV